jgi:hypothetical protein
VCSLEACEAIRATVELRARKLKVSAKIATDHNVEPKTSREVHEVPECHSNNILGIRDNLIVAILIAVAGMRCWA